MFEYQSEFLRHKEEQQGKRRAVILEIIGGLMFGILLGLLLS